TASRKPDDDAHEAGRIGLRASDARQCRQRRRTCSELNKSSTGKIRHGATLLCCRNEESPTTRHSALIFAKLATPIPLFEARGIPSDFRHRLFTGVRFLDYIFPNPSHVEQMGRIYTKGNISVWVYANDHLPPHFHINSPGAQAIVEIATFELYA